MAPENGQGRIVTPYVVLPNAAEGYSTPVHEPASGSKYAVASFIPGQGLEERGRVCDRDP
jgi:hypothetical protein